MANYDVYDLKAAKVGEVELADEVFACEVNTQAIFDAVLRQQSSWRQGTHKVKNRREVSGGGKKPFRQKGTGRARQGSSRAVQYRGGGIAFGPTPRSHTFKLNRKVRRLALRSGLTLKAQANEMFVLDSIAMDAMKTKEFVKVLGGFKADRKSLFVVDIEDDFDNAYKYGTDKAVLRQDTKVLYNGVKESDESINEVIESIKKHKRYYAIIIDGDIKYHTIKLIHLKMFFL